MSLFYEEAVGMIFDVDLYEITVLVELQLAIEIPVSD
jgi:hypothetical protein